jgi:hypothetical protein
VEPSRDGRRNLEVRDVDRPLVGGPAKMASGELRDALDHPVFFVIVLTIAVSCMAVVASWGLKAAGLPGPANVFRN